MRTHSSGEARFGLVQIFTGEGKGKTTAALGTAIRSLGHGFKVFIVFFMKGDYACGERKILSQLPNVTLASFGSTKLIDPADIKKEVYDEAKKAFETVRKVVMSGEYDLVVLDEINLAVHWELVSLDGVVKLIKDKPKKVELILTGRYAAPELLELADLITECRNVKHPFTKGIIARPGIEY